MALVALFVRRVRILASCGRRCCRACSLALVAIANNVLKAGRYGTAPLNVTMLFGETSTKC
jgi:hypothetical protein